MRRPRHEFDYQRVQIDAMSHPRVPPYCMALIVDFFKVIFSDGLENKILICRFIGLQLFRTRIDGSSQQVGNSENSLNFIFQSLQKAQNMI